jgi:DNA-binding transcriptional MocR family regulator
MSIRAIKWAHNTLPDVDLPPTECAVLMTLAFFHNDATGECFPSIATVSRHCGACERRVKQATALLAEMGLISWKRGGTSEGNASNRYTLFGKPNAPDKTGNRVPVSSRVKRAQKSPFQTGNRVPVSNGQTSAHDRGYINGTAEAFSRSLKIVGGRDA